MMQGHFILAFFALARGFAIRMIRLVTVMFKAGKTLRFYET
jgi:hypothetical protein